MRYFKWGYSWEELKALYIAKSKEYAKKRRIDYQFLIDLAKAALGGGSKDENTYDLDTGEGLEEMTEEQEADMRVMLGDDFEHIYQG